MYKRVIALALCLLLTAAVLPLGVSAAEEDVSQVRKQISSDYNRALSASGVESMHGYCGLLASYQIYYRGINTSPIPKDGRDQYDTYCDLDYTTGGYRVKAYSAEDYSLEEAMNAATNGGTRDVYNILVGFQSTNTEAGSIYGHAVFVYAVLDGTVYFTESFASPLCYTAGGVIAVSIEEFARYYNTWTRFEGIIVFGNRDYADTCTQYASHLYARATEPTLIVSQPCAPGSEEADSLPVRTVVPGERLLVTGLFENTLGQYYYRVSDSGTEGYVAANTLEPVRFNYEDVTLSNASVPQTLAVGESFTLTGKITSGYHAISAVYMTVTDQAGNVVMGHSFAKNSGIYDLKNDTFSEAMNFAALEEGYYTYALCAECVNSYVSDGQLLIRSSEIVLESSEFIVGELPAREQTEPDEAEAEDGWVFRQGTWYYFYTGTPWTGWLYDDGVTYYLRDDGSVTTGRATVEGKDRLFTDTGAMRTGWLDTEQGRMYLLNDGIAAQGWQQIVDKRYYFDENGILFTDGWFTDGEECYYLYSDGSAAQGWAELEEGHFCFHQVDGHLLAKTSQEDGITYIHAYDSDAGVMMESAAVTVNSLATYEQQESQ